MQRTAYQSLDSRSTWSMAQVVAIGAVVAISAVATGAAVASSTSSTALYAPAAVRPTTARVVAPAPRMNIREAPAMAAMPQQSGVEYEMAAPVSAPATQGFNLVQLFLVPASALLAGLAAYMMKTPSQQSWAMAASEGETDIVGKSYKSSSRADSYYGKPAGETVKQVNPMENTYKAPVGGYSAKSEKTYVPTTEVAKSYFGQPQPGPTAKMVTYAPPSTGYSADNGKSYKPTTNRADSYFGKDQGAKEPVLGAYWYGPDRPKWLGPFANSQNVAPHLKGELAGDYGFDPSGLGANPIRLARYQEAELMNGRWAMLGALGCVLPEALAKFAGYGVAEPLWFKSNAAIFANIGLDFEANSGHIQSIFGHGNSGATIPTSPVLILLTEVVLMGVVEGFRANRITGRDGLYPGKFFDPLGLANDPNAFADLKVKEIKNGRLAMLAMLGFFIQAAVTHQGPVDNLLTHLADPVHNTIFTTGL